MQELGEKATFTMLKLGEGKTMGLNESMDASSVLELCRGVSNPCIYLHKIEMSSHSEGHLAEKHNLRGH